MTSDNIDSSETVHKAALLALGRLSNAKRWFAHRGWDVLPQDDRGRILRWGADHAWLAGQDNPKRSVRRWCRKYSPDISKEELDQIVSETATSNKRWTGDQSAAVLGITVRDRETLRLWFIGADDDPDYEHRRQRKREKAKARSRKYRAAHSTGRPRGRPKSETPPAWQAAGFKSERTYYRHKARGTTSGQNGSKNASRHISKNISRDVFSLPPELDRRAPQARAHLPAVVEPVEVLDGEIIDAGVALGAPPRPASHLERALAWALVLHQRQQQGEVTR